MSSKTTTITTVLDLNQPNQAIKSNYNPMPESTPNNSKNGIPNFLTSRLNFISKISLESRLAFALLTFTFTIIWFFNIGEYKTYIYNYSFCLALAGLVGCLQSFFYSFAQITRDLKSKNWFTIGMDTIFNLFQILLLIAGVRELTQRVDPFNTSLYVFYAAIVFFAQVYINKSYSMFKTTLICTFVLALVTLVFRILLTYTPSSYLDLIWAVGSYSILACTIVLFFATIKFSSNSLTKMER